MRAVMVNKEQGQLVFLVDDEPLVLKALKRVVKGEGLVVRDFASAAEALEALESERPVCVVSDYYMPKMDGLELLARVGQLYPGVFRALLTGGNIDDRVNRALGEKVVQLVVQKPWKSAAIREMMKAASGNINPAKTTSEQAVQTKEPESEISSPCANPGRADEKREPAVLVVDDEPAFLSLMKVWLKRLGLRPLVSLSAEPVLEMIEAERPELLLIDLIMPGTDGLSLIDAVRDVYPGLPLVAISGMQDRDMAVEAFRRGANSFLDKPIELDILEETIHRCIRFSSILADWQPAGEMAAAMEIRHAMASGVPVNQLLNVLLQIMLRHTGADSASVLLLQPDDSSLRIAASYGMDDDVTPEDQINAGEGIAGWVIEHDEPQVVVGQAPDDLLPPGRQRIRQPLVGLCLPMRGRNQVIGTLNLTRFAGTQPFTRADVELGLLLSGDVARSIELVEASGERLDMERDLMRRDKLITIGELVSGVAHEINNPLGYVNSNVSTLTDYVDEIMPLLRSLAPENGEPETAKILSAAREIDLKFVLDDLPTCLAETKEGIARVLKIVADLKNFARDDTDVMELADVNQIIDGAVGILWNQIKYKAELVREYSELPRIPCYPSQLGQVFLNLVHNATQAIERSGRIIIRTRIAGDRLLVEVEDDGCGMDGKILGRIFDSFYTTKPKGVGTGLGLSIARKIVRRHNGGISANSEPGRGSTFRVELPLSNDRE